MFKVWKIIESDRRVIILLVVSLVCLLLMNIMLWFGWKNAPNKIRVYIPPNLSTGISQKIGEIPKSNIHAFAFNIWQLLNTWSENGETDYRQSLANLRNYLTPQFRERLQHDYQQRKDDGQLLRIRYLQGINGIHFQEDNVQELEHGVWEVTLPMRLVEWVKDLKVKDIKIEYKLRIVRFNVSQQHNPWGLAIAGFVTEPTRIQKYNKNGDSND